MITRKTNYKIGTDENTSYHIFVVDIGVFIRIR